MKTNNNKHTASIAKSTIKMSIVTTISRVFGLLRDQIQAALLGTTFIADSFAVGFMLPNLLRRLLAEGNMVASFIPVLTEVEKENGSEDSVKFFRSVFTLLSIILFFIVILGIIVSPVIVKILFTSARGNSEAISLAVQYSRIMFPYLMFISLAALMQGVLNTKGYYAISAASPILLNIIIISISLTIYFTARDLFANMAYVFSFAVLLGGLVQFAYQIPFVKRLGYSFSPLYDFKNKYVLKMVKLFIPGIFGSSIYQINLLVSTGFAGFIGEGRVSALTFATRLHEFTLGVFAVSIATVMLPTLSRLIVLKQMEEARETLSYSIRLVAIATIPATFGFLCLNKEIVSMLFEYGIFSKQSVNLVSSALSYLSISLFFVASYRIIVQSFYAMKDMKTPVYVATLAFFINAGTNYLCVYIFKFDIKGIAISSVLSNIISFCILYILLKRKMKVKNILNNKKELLKTFISSIFMAIAVYSLKYYLITEKTNRIALVIKTISIIIIAVLIYSFINIVLKNKDFTSLIEIFTSKFIKKFFNKN